MRALFLALALTLAFGGMTASRAEAKPGARSCLRALDDLGVDYVRAKKKGIAIGVRVKGDIGGVRYKSFTGKALILDCSLVYSLAMAGRFFAEHGITSATYSAAYQRRKVRGSSRMSKHSYGLALDVHVWRVDDETFYDIRDDYEQGLGDELDCIGEPLTEGGRVLRTLACQLERSELFYSILDPDYDVAHFNHFHIEALPWAERSDTP